MTLQEAHRKANDLCQRMGPGWNKDVHETRPGHYSYSAYLGQTSVSQIQGGKSYVVSVQLPWTCLIEKDEDLAAARRKMAKTLSRSIRSMSTELTRLVDYAA